MEDGRIIDLYLMRNELALEATSTKYGTRIRSVAQNIVQDLSTAEECENDTYLECWKCIPPNEPRDHFYAFILRIVRNLSLNCCRYRNQLKRKAHITELSEEMEQCIPGPSDVEGQLDGAVLGQIISDYLRTLPKEKRDIFIRRYWYLDSVKTIADRFGISQGKVKTILFRTRGELKSYLEQEGYVL